MPRSMSARRPWRCSAKQLKEREAWLADRLHRLKHNQGAATRLWKEMEEFAASHTIRSQSLREGLESAVTYFGNQKHRMHYGYHTARHQPIGSGVTEAACKVLIKQRFCRSVLVGKSKGARQSSPFLAPQANPRSLARLLETYLPIRVLFYSSPHKHHIIRAPTRSCNSTAARCSTDHAGRLSGAGRFRRSGRRRARPGSRAAQGEFGADSLASSRIRGIRRKSRLPWPGCPCSGYFSKPVGARPSRLPATVSYRGYGVTGGSPVCRSG